MASIMSSGLEARLSHGHDDPAVYLTGSLNSAEAFVDVFADNVLTDSPVGSTVDMVILRVDMPRGMNLLPNPDYAGSSVPAVMTMSNIPPQYISLQGRYRYKKFDDGPNGVREFKEYDMTTTKFAEGMWTAEISVFDPDTNQWMPTAITNIPALSEEEARELMVNMGVLDNPLIKVTSIKPTGSTGEGEHADRSLPISLHSDPFDPKNPTPRWWADIGMYSITWRDRSGKVLDPRKSETFEWPLYSPNVDGVKQVIIDLADEEDIELTPSDIDILEIRYGGPTTISKHRGHKMATSHLSHPSYNTLRTFQGPLTTAPRAYEVTYQRRDPSTGELVIESTRVIADTVVEVLKIMTEALGTMGTMFVLWRIKPLRALFGEIVGPSGWTAFGRYRVTYRVRVPGKAPEAPKNVEILLLSGNVNQRFIAQKISEDIFVDDLESVAAEDVEVLNIEHLGPVGVSRHAEQRFESLDDLPMHVFKFYLSIPVPQPDGQIFFDSKEIVVRAPNVRAGIGMLRGMGGVSLDHVVNVEDITEYGEHDHATSTSPIHRYGILEMLLESKSPEEVIADIQSLWMRGKLTKADKNELIRMVKRMEMEHERPPTEMSGFADTVGQFDVKVLLSTGEITHVTLTIGSDAPPDDLLRTVGDMIADFYGDVGYEIMDVERVGITKMTEHRFNRYIVEMIDESSGLEYKVNVIADDVERAFEVAISRVTIMQNPTHGGVADLDSLKLVDITNVDDPFDKNYNKPGYRPNTPYPKNPKRR